VAECPNHPTQTGDEADHDDKEHDETPAGADAGRTDEGFGDEPFKRILLPARLRRKQGQRFRRG